MTGTDLKKGDEAHAEWGGGKVCNVDASQLGVLMLLLGRRQSCRGQV